jgi:DNA repair protein RadA/Sms
VPIAFKCGKNDRGGCGYIAPEPWLGRCPGCGGFFDCRQINADIPGAKAADVSEGELVSLQDVVDSGEAEDVVERFVSHIEGLDFVTGGGFARGGIYLLCGDPGAGKTTLLLYALSSLAKKSKLRVMYVTGEQSVKALAGYVRRMQLKLPASFLAIRETEQNEILDHIVEQEPNVVVIDSIQMIENIDREYEAGSAAAIRSAIVNLSKAAEEFDCTIIIIAHVTKEGILAGPKALEHLVDVFLYLQGSKHEQARYLKCESKNRFGETPRTARFMMTREGLIDCYREDQGEGEKQAKDEASTHEAAKEKPKKMKSKTAAKKATPATALPPPKKNDALVDANRLAQIDRVLAIACEVPGCKGRKGLACVMKKDTAMFHEWRVTQA